MLDLATSKSFKLAVRLRSLFSLVLLLLLGHPISGCQPQEEFGFLRVNAPSTGTFEIYRIAKQQPFQLISEEVGRFNRDIRLTAGSYLVLADCSNESVVITPNRRKILIAHDVVFKPPVNPKAQDKFTIQCSRSQRTQDRQRIVNRFKLTILDGTTELLIGMAPLSISFDHDSPETKNFKLSAVRVADFSERQEIIRFFVSPKAGILSVTESQELGNWLFLMPGEYLVELNGSISSLSLSANEMYQVQPGFLRVQTSKAIDIGINSTVKGDPLHYEINGGHWLYLNHTYPILPGNIVMRLQGMERDQNLKLVSNETVIINARSVMVELDCPAWDWNCIGSKKVFLYNEGQHYPFATGVTNIPLLYFGDDAWVSLEGSQDLRFKIADKTQDKRLKAGFVQLVPKIDIRPGFVTDLVRLEAVNKPFAGHTLDIHLSEPTMMPLIKGSFHLAHYQTLQNNDGDRRKSSRRIFANHRKRTTVKFPVFVNEKKWRQTLARTEKLLELRKSAIFRNASRNKRPARPIYID